MKTNIYINIAVIGSVNDILSTILDKIYNSGLYKFCDKIYLIVNGDINKINIELKDKYEIINKNIDISKCEFPTLEKIWIDSKNEDFNILYLHTELQNQIFSQL